MQWGAAPEDSQGPGFDRMTDVDPDQFAQMDGRSGSCHPPQSLHSSCHGVSGTPRGDKPVAQCQKKGERGGPLALPSQGRQAHSLGRGLFSPLPKLAPLAVAPHPPSFTNHRRQVHAQHAQHRRGRSPSSPRLLHHARLFFEEFRIMAVARCLCALLALAVAPAPATAQMTVDLTSRGEFPVHGHQSHPTPRARRVDSRSMD